MPYFVDVFFFQGRSLYDVISPKIENKMAGNFEN